MCMCATPRAYRRYIFDATNTQSQAGNNLRGNGLGARLPPAPAPSFLTRVLRTARVGLFLHTPFPSSEIFRTLPFREDLLRGMLDADQVCVGVQDILLCTQDVTQQTYWMK